jgi:rare lipoprotein A (peptidoglycan hydrolase)
VLERPVHAGFATHVVFNVVFNVEFTVVLIVVALAASSGCSHRAVAKTPAPAKIGATESGIASWYGIPYHGRRAASGEIYDMEQFTAAHRTLPFQTWVEVTDLDNGKRVDVRITDRGPFVNGRIIDLSLAAARKIDMVGAGTARVKLKVIPPPRGSENSAAQKTERATTARSESPPPDSRPASSAPISPTPITRSAPAAQSTPVSRPLPPQNPPENSPRPLSSIPAYVVQVAAFAGRDRAEAFLVSLRAQFGEMIDEARVIAGPPGWRVVLGRQMTLDDANDLAAKLRAADAQALVVAER